MPCERKVGADVQDRTGDLVLTKDALCQLSYIGLRPSGFGRQVGLLISELGRQVGLVTQLPASFSISGARAVRWPASRSSRSERRLPFDSRSGHPERNRG